MLKDAWKQKVIYHILLDRYAGMSRPNDWDKPEYIDGNFAGVTASIPYLKDLGVDVIWLSPFTTGLEYHGYHTTDFYTVDPHFGTERDIKTLIDTAHENGMKIICDFVPNHVSTEHAYFIEAKNNPKSDYRKWFYFQKQGRSYKKFLGFGALAKLNLNYKPAMEHVQGAGHKWLSLGFDGLRLDHIIGLSNKNVIELLRPLRESFPESIFIGEVWLSDVKLSHVRTLRVSKKYPLWFLWRFGDNANDLLYRNYVGILDGILDFSIAAMLEKYANAPSVKEQKMLEKAIRKQSTKFPSLLQFTFLDNHDVERFLFRVSGDVKRLEKAAELQFSLDQPAIIYYGTEVGVTQEASFASRTHHADLLARKSMEWDVSKQNSELRDFYKNLIRRRKT